MGTLSIPRKNIQKIVLHGGRKRQTAQQVLNSLTEKPDYIINAMMYDFNTGITSADTIVDGELINGGNYTQKGIAFNTIMDMTETLSSTARSKKYKYFMGGSPNLMWEGKVNIDRYNYRSVPAFTDYEVNQQKAIRIGMGFTASDLIFYYPSEKTTIKHVGEYLYSKGCITAINLDGGGSTRVCQVVNGKLENLNDPTENRPNSTWILIYLRKTAKKPESINPPKEEVKVEVKEEPVTVTTPNTDTNKENTTQTGGTKVTQYHVMLDPGHGGTDPGAVGKVLGYEEDKIALVIANKTKAHLERCGIKVSMTRTSDKNVSISERCRLANKATTKVHRFVSIHCNSAESTSATGVETWCYSANGAGNVFAKAIQSKLAAGTKDTDRGVKVNSSLGVLSGTSMTACLVEVGFLSNAAMEAKLGTDIYQETIAECIAQGICQNLGVAWVDFEKYDTSDWRVVAMKRVCEKYGLDMDHWYARRDMQITVGEMYGILSSVLLKLEK